MLEMGRAFVASCGYYLTCVHECKKNNDRNYCIVDGGMHQIQYDGQIRGMYQPKCRMYPEEKEKKKNGPSVGHFVQRMMFWFGILS